MSTATLDRALLDTLDTFIRAQLPAAADGDRDAYGRIVAACQNTVTVAGAVQRLRARQRTLARIHDDGGDRAHRRQSARRRGDGGANAGCAGSAPLSVSSAASAA